MTEIALFNVSAVLYPDMSEDEWQDIGEQIAIADWQIPWIAGDWVHHGKQHYSDGMDQACKILTHLAETTVARYGFVAGRFPPERRVNLSFWHHSEAAMLPAQEADRILAKAVDERLTQRDVRNLAQKVKAEIKGRMPELDTDRLRLEREQERNRVYAEYYRLLGEVEEADVEYVQVPKDLFVALKTRVPAPKET